MQEPVIKSYTNEDTEIYNKYSNGNLLNINDYRNSQKGKKNKIKKSKTAYLQM